MKTALRLAAALLLTLALHAECQEANEPGKVFLYIYQAFDVERGLGAEAFVAEQGDYSGIAGAIRIPRYPRWAIELDLGGKRPTSDMTSASLGVGWLSESPNGMLFYTGLRLGAYSYDDADGASVSEPFVSIGGGLHFYPGGERAGVRVEVRYSASDTDSAVPEVFELLVGFTYRWTGKAGR